MNENERKENRREFLKRSAATLGGVPFLFVAGKKTSAEAFGAEPEVGNPYAGCFFCGGKCSLSCGDCTSACTSKCKIVCGDCTVSCGYGCGTELSNASGPRSCGDCLGSCKGGCKTGCNTGCNTSCKNSCKGNCSESCSGSCSSKCSSSCSGDCGRTAAF